MTRSAGRGGPESGSVLVIALLATSVITTLGLMLALATTVETEIASNVHASVQALALAEAAGERAAAELAALPSWDLALAGAATAAFFDGSHGLRRAGGTTIDLDGETAWLLCGASSCAGRSPDVMTGARPWGSNNPRWTVYASGSAVTLLGIGGRSAPGYAVVWVGDDPAENDANPLQDGGPPVADARSLENPGLDAIGLRAVAWGARGSRREVESVVERADRAAHTGVRLRVWREVRGALP
jgi:hypothetical protein